MRLPFQIPKQGHGVHQGATSAATALLPVFVLTCLLFSVGLSLPQSVTLAIGVSVCSISVSGIFRRIGMESSFILGFVGLICLVVPLNAFLVAILGGIREPLSIGVLIVSAVAMGLIFLKEMRNCDADDAGWFGTVALVAVLGMITKMWYFTSPLIPGLVFLTCLQAKRLLSMNKKIYVSLRSFGLVLLAVGAVWAHELSLRSSSEGAIFRTSDQYFRASLGTGVISFGVNENMGAAGLPIRYHWLSEGFINLLGRLLSLNPTNSVVRLSPVLGSLAAAAAAYVLVLATGGRRLQAAFGALMISALSVLLYSQGVNILKTTEMGQFWGTPMFLFGVLLIYLFVSHRNHVAAVLLIVWFQLMVMTNTTLGLSLACGTGLVLLVASFRRRVEWRWSVLVVGSMLVSLPILRATILAPTNLQAFTPRFRLDDPFGFAWAFGYEGKDGIERAIVGVAFLVVLWFQGGAALWLRGKDPLQASRSFFSLFTLGAIPPAFVFSILGDAEQYRFLNPILILGPISIALASDLIIKSIKVGRGLILVVCLGLGIWLGQQADVLTKTFGTFEMLRPRLEYAAKLVVVPPTVFLIVYLASRLRKFTSLRSVSLVGIFGFFSVVVSVTAQIDSGRGQFEYSKTLIGPSSENRGRIECLDFVRSVTDRESVVASYMWRFGEDAYTEKWFLVSAMSERRAFIDGPIYVENPQGDLIKLRQDVTTRFVEVGPNYADRAVMLKAGVEYFIVDARWTKRQSWKPYAERAYSNSDCIVLRLNKPVS